MDYITWFDVLYVISFHVIFGLIFFSVSFLPLKYVFNI